jgi:hypothetical protein
MLNRFTFLWLLLASYLPAQTIQLTPVSPAMPWLVGAKQAGDDRMFLIGQNGYIQILNADGQILPTPFLDWSTKIKLDGEQGLLGLAFHPNYAVNKQFFIFYSRVGTGETVVSRMTTAANDPNTADLSTEQELLSFPHPLPNHVGGSLEFGPDGYLYISIGDGGAFEDPNNNGQNTTHWLGKILRIDVDQGNPYTIPPDNPFISLSSVLPEIWCTGLRNPWRMTFDRLLGDTWIGDVGQKAREEVNFVPAGGGGLNFGWSCGEGTLPFRPCTNTPIFTDPLFEYDHIPGSNCSGSITGGYVYRGTKWGALWGKYLFTDFCTGEIRALTREDNTVSVVSLGNFTPFDYVSFGEDQAGELYLAGYFSNKLHKIASTDCSPVAQIIAPDTIFTCSGVPIGQSLEAYGYASSGMLFQWMKDGVEIADAQLGTFLTSEPGQYQVLVRVPGSACSAVSNPIVVQALPPITTSFSLSVPFGTVLPGSGVVIQQDTTITETYTAINGCDSTVVYDIKVVSGNNELVLSSIPLKVAPNPAQNNATMSVFFSKRLEEGQLEIWNMQGQLMRTDYLSEMAAGGQQISVFVGDFPSGHYLLRLKVGWGVGTLGLIIQH